LEVDEQEKTHTDMSKLFWVFEKGWSVKGFVSAEEGCGHYAHSGPGKGEV